MSTSLDTEVKEYLYGMTKIPTGKKMVLCQVCTAFRPKQMIITGRYEGANVLCENCIKKYQGLAYLVCQKCGKFLGFYKPGIVKLESGVRVEIEPGDTLHTMWCSFCNPNESQAEIVEFYDIMNMAHKNTPTKDVGLNVKGV